MGNSLDSFHHLRSFGTPLNVDVHPLCCQLLRSATGVSSTAHRPPRSSRGGRLSSCSRRHLLGALPDQRPGSAARLGWDRILQFVTGEGGSSFLFGPVPVWGRGGLDLEGKGLVRRGG